MAGIIVRHGLKDNLTVWLNTIANQAYKFGLFTNDLTPDVNTILTDLTEASWTGYQRETVPIAFVPLWDAITESYTVEIQGVTFLGFDGLATDVYGYMLIDAANLLIAAQRFDDAPVPGGTPITPIVVIPTINLRNL